MLKEKQKKNEADGTAKKVRLGYFSGSATHLDDIEMIVPVLKQLLGKNPTLDLLIVGPPLTDPIFNPAKSENIWLEAALVQTVTAASNLGAFAEMVQDGEDGVL